MNGWLWRLAPYLICALLALGIWQQRGTIAGQTAALTAYGERLDAQDAAMRKVTTGIQQGKDDLRQLVATQEDFRSALESRRSDIEDLKRENEDFRRWADGMLPEPVARMRERPTITGADGYSEHLRTRSPVRAVGQPAGPQ